MSHPQPRSFASDNDAPMHPEVAQALADVPLDHALAYGADPVTVALAQVVEQSFGAGAQVYPVLTGTGANVVSLSAILPRWGWRDCFVGGAPEHR